MDGSPAKPMVDEFRLLYAIDQELYTILVRDLSRNSSECLTIMGLWLWFERLGFPNIVSNIVGLIHVMIDQLTDEAITCLRVVNNQLPCALEAGLVPLTCRLLETDMFVQYLKENRASVFHEVNRLVSNVCIPSLSDLMERARHGGFGVGQREASPSLEENLSGLSLEDPSGGRDGENNCMMPDLGRRSMFAVFSEGSPVGENEIRRFFSSMFGEWCIESVGMLHDAEQPLYARIVFHRASFVRSILNGDAAASKVRFVMKGRDVWMMQYLARRHWRMLCPGEGPSSSRHP